MTPVKFPQVNITYGPPAGMAESQVQSIPAYDGQVQGGSCDGCRQVVVAYQLDAADLEVLKDNDGIIFLSMIGGLAPHYLSFDFETATHPA
jgi:hypothetical protein